MIHATADCETDPFEFGRITRPFVFGFYDGTRFVSFWNEKTCVKQFVEFVESLEEPHIIWFHNGGKFDFFQRDGAGHSLIRHFGGSVRIINSRVVLAKIGKHEFRDSFAILPFSLATYAKDEIDYRKLESNVRVKHRTEILKYLRSDCVNLHELTSGFAREFGTKRVTVGSNALAQLKSFHEFKTFDQLADMKFRKDFYHGGRNQCFASGLILRPVKIYDVNSMYPAVMRDSLHPTSTALLLSKTIQPETCFVSVEGWNNGAFPVRTKTGLDFTVRYGTFHTSIHEYRAAIDTGAFRTRQIHRCYGFEDRVSFAEFVNHFYDARNRAKKGGDKILALLYKFVLNSAYGKFAQNPANFFDYQIVDIGDVETNLRYRNEICEHCKQLETTDGLYQCLSATCRSCLVLNSGDTPEYCMFCNGSGFKWFPEDEHDNYTIYRARIMRLNYLNVACGASITGAARAILMRGLAGAANPLYCDTDSIICENLTGVEIDDSKLGAWKLEAAGDGIAIAGKKLYVVFSSTPPDDVSRETLESACLPDGRTVYCIKKAHKGAKLTAQQIINVALGATVEYANPVPAFQRDGRDKWTKRRIRKTAT